LKNEYLILIHRDMADGVFRQNVFVIIVR